MKWLKFFREKSGLSISKLANLTGVQTNTVWRWENGRAIPSADMVRNLANALKLSETELLNGPISEEWELKIRIATEGVIEVGKLGSLAELSVGDKAMAITLSASYELWEDDAKFEILVEDLRKKRAVGLKTHKEAF